MLGTPSKSFPSWKQSKNIACHPNPVPPIMSAIQSSSMMIEFSLVAPAFLRIDKPTRLIVFF